MAVNNRLLQRPQGNITATFSGHPHEGPENFMRRIEREFEHRMIDDKEKVDIVLRQLLGKANKWADSYASTLLEYNDFRRRFLRRVDNEGLKMDLLDIVYSHKQGNEPVEVYLGEQWALALSLAAAHVEESLAEERTASRPMRLPPPVVQKSFNTQKNSNSQKSYFKN